MIPITRIVTICMAGVLAFALLVPMALQRHNSALAFGIGAVFLAYVVANILLWRQQTKPRA